MALVTDTLLDYMRRFTDQEYDDFEGFPETIEDSREAMSEAVYQYAKDIVPVSTTASLAKDAMKDSLGDMSDITMKTAFDNFASTLGGGMVGFTATPPQSQIKLSPVAAIGERGGSAFECMQELVSIVDAWFKTGTATNEGTGATTNWS